MTMIRAWFAALTFIIGAAMPALAQGPPASAVNVDAEGLALHGHDPVAYFTEGKAVPGVARFEHQWNGARWRFANAETSPQRSLHLPAKRGRGGRWQIGSWRRTTTC